MLETPSDGKGAGVPGPLGLVVEELVPGLPLVPQFGRELSKRTHHLANNLVWFTGEERLLLPNLEERTPESPEISGWP